MFVAVVSSTTNPIDSKIQMLLRLKVMGGDPPRLSYPDWQAETPQVQQLGIQGQLCVGTLAQDCTYTLQSRGEETAMFSFSAPMAIRAMKRIVINTTWEFFITSEACTSVFVIRWSRCGQYSQRCRGNELGSPSPFLLFSL